MACITDCPPPGFSLKLPTIFKEGEVEVPPPVVAQDLGEAPPAFETRVCLFGYMDTSTVCSRCQVLGWMIAMMYEQYYTNSFQITPIPYKNIIRLQ